MQRLYEESFTLLQHTHVDPDSGVVAAVNRLYELTVGLNNAHSPDVFLKTPRRNPSAVSPSPCVSEFPPPITFFIVFASCNEQWQCADEPVRFENGFAMNVARRLCFSASERTMNLKNACLSAVVRQSA